MGGGTPPTWVREGGRLRHSSWLPLPRKGDERSEVTDPEINPSVSSVDDPMLSPMTFCYFCFSLETKEQTNKIQFHPPSGSILMSLYLCDMVSSSRAQSASGKQSLRSWLHKAFIFRSAVAADTSPQSRKLHRLSELSGRVYHHSDSLASISES